MKVAILAVGSRGDVQPFVALGRGLKAAGMEVILATGTDFQQLALDQGLRYAPIRADFYRLVESREGREMLAGNPVHIARVLKRTILPSVRNILDDSWRAAMGADAIVYHPKVLSGAHLAERLGVPCFAGLVVPLSPTREFAVPGLSHRNLGGWLNRLSYSLLRTVALPFRGVVNRWRREALGLPPRPRFANELEVEGRPIPILYSYSQHLVQRPLDWPACHVVTGYWFLDRIADWTPPIGLTEFLAKGPPPVYIGFGSMAGRRPERAADVVLKALERTQRRGIIATGWGGIRPSMLPATVFQLEGVCHDWLFPRTSAVVHHGGAGTTASGLRAGRPTVICPFAVDQPFWGHRVHELGVGPRPLPQRKLRTDNLAAAIHLATTDASMIRRAREIGARIRSERGVEQAVEVIKTAISDRERRQAQP